MTGTSQESVAHGSDELCGNSHETITTGPRHHQIDHVDCRVVDGGCFVVDESGVIGDEHIAGTWIGLGDDLGRLTAT